MATTDFLVIGGGVIGVAIARELRRRHAGASVTLLEKEPRCGEHASGRNSGVLHAGFYYTPDSLKAKFTRDGNRELTAYCDAKKLRINKCGKLVVAKNPSELASLDTLLDRGRKNGVQLEMLTAQQAREIEPRVKTCERALFSPTTSAVDPNEVMAAMEQDAHAEGVDFRLGERFLAKQGAEIVTTAGRWNAAYVINAAGLYADRIAQQFGFSENYRILPFKGLYLYSNEPPGSLRTHIYPVPDLRNPFLGVHYTLTVEGKLKIGPTAIPAFWREQYTGFERFDAREFAEVVARQLGLLAFSKFDFKKLAFEEIRKYSRAVMVEQAAALLENVRESDYTKWGRAGIRAQLLDLRTQKLEMDFVLEGDAQSMHVLNAVSPAFTCSLPFARHVCDEIDSKLTH